MRRSLSALPIAAAGLAAASAALAAGASADRVAADLLAAHNAERVAVGLPALAWDPALADAASDYAAELAALGDIRHSPAYARRSQGENLWMGTRSAFDPRRMVQDWASEKRFFRPGTFPNNASGRHWSEIGHYTQMIWPGTTRVGCGLRSGRGYDFLVCRYSPAGNVIGQRIP